MHFTFRLLKETNKETNKTLRTQHIPNSVSLQKPTPYCQIFYKAQPLAS